MTEAAIRQALDLAVREVLEKMFFLEAGPAASLAPADITSEIAVRVAFQGTPPGSLLLRLGSARAGQIAADFLGVETAEVSAPETDAVVRELANMVCGSVLSRVESSTTFQLDAPRIVAADNEAAFAGVGLAFDLEGGRLAVSLLIDTAQCLEPVQSAY